MCTNDSYYCSQQIQIPPPLPDILKQFTKAAIRTQPKDSLTWSKAYFKAMSTGDIPPIKERLEIMDTVQKNNSKLTPGILKTLHKQLGSEKYQTREMVQSKWNVFSLSADLFQEIWSMGNLNERGLWLDFLAMAASTLHNSIEAVMIELCTLLTNEPSGGEARIPVELWTTLYKILCRFANISTNHVNQVLAFLSYDTKKQNGFISPKNFTHEDCPRLQPGARNQTNMSFYSTR